MPEDGVERVLYLISEKQRVGLSINRGHWSESVPVFISKNLRTIQTTIRTEGAPTLRANGTRLQPSIDKYGRYVYQLPQSDEVKVEVRM